MNRASAYALVGGIAAAWALHGLTVTLALYHGLPAAPSTFATRAAAALIALSRWTFTLAAVGFLLMLLRPGASAELRRLWARLPFRRVPVFSPTPVLLTMLVCVLWGWVSVGIGWGFAATIPELAFILFVPIYLPLAMLSAPVNLLLALLRTGVPQGSPAALSVEWALGGILLHAAVSAADPGESS